MNEEKHYAPIELSMDTIHISRANMYKKRLMNHLKSNSLKKFNLKNKTRILIMIMILFFGLFRWIIKISNYKKKPKRKTKLFLKKSNI
jgi:hypothetical protein